MSRYIRYEDAGKMALAMVGITNTEWLRVLRGLPSIEIIRCGECKWRKAKMMPKSVKCLFSGNADDFCSYGERKTNAD